MNIGGKMYYYIVQAIGIVGMILAFISFQKNSNKQILLYQTFAAVAFTLHFWLLGAFTGAAMNILGASRNIVFYNREKSWANKKFWVYLFITLYVISGILTWKNIFSLLPILAMSLATVGLWIKNSKITRYIILPTSPCWLIYNLVNKSISGVLTETFVLSSLLIAIIRFDILKIKVKLQNNTQKT